jgi:hypothetical protein
VESQTQATLHHPRDRVIYSLVFAKAPTSFNSVYTPLEAHDIFSSFSSMASHMFFTLFFV